MTELGKVSKKPRGKQPKRFLEKNDALSLASLIAEQEEKKVLNKAERHHKSEDDLPKSENKAPSKAKAKLKETKTILSAHRVKAKKERSKLRKERFKEAKRKEQGVTTPPSTNEKPETEKPIRKKVSFA
ncbi:hypothetical protein D9619_012100 [Psilocybe cf. subviscida]|uniref:Uncharacterized protein n=1 Tax=Psilocybe cf. subviscida TaxID=2480587 RepID=A0A8H5B773_9AGAR|nr:hypothetical protein D9619_012100 [Psilocybe cf. subviscida]